MIKIRRRAFVKVRRNDIHVRGDQLVIARMMIACAMSLERMGWNMEAVKTAIKTMERVAEDAGSKAD